MCLLLLQVQKTLQTQRKHYKETTYDQGTFRFSSENTRRKAPSKSALIEPSKNAQRKKGGSHRTPWRPSRTKSTDTTNQQAFTEIHHNKPLVFCFLEDNPKAKECRQCHNDFSRQKKIIPYDVVLSHEKWSYPDPMSQATNCHWQSTTA